MRNHIETKRYVIPRGRAVLPASLVFFFAFFVLGLSGCGNTNAKPKAGEAAPTVSDKTLYVTNGNGGKLLAFDIRVLGGTLTVQGENILPTRQFPDTVSSPAGLFLDRGNDILYVANSGQNAIQIYDNASTLTTPLTASRVISGNLTQLDQPFGLSFDPTSGKLFVANRDGNTIVAFCIGTSGSGNIAPCNLLKGDLTELDTPRALAVDTTKKILYISNMGNNSILVYRDSDSIGATATQCVTDFSACNVAPFAIIAPHTEVETASKLELPFGLYIDIQNDRLYVANTGLNSPAVLIYEEASKMGDTSAANKKPERVLTGLNTQLTVPAGIDVDESNGTLYILNNNSPNNVNIAGEDNTGSPSLLVFNDLDTNCTTVTQACNLSPDRRIGGDVSVQSGTTLTHPIGLAFDASRDVTYVANTGGNNIIIYSLEGNAPPFKISAGNKTLLDVPAGFFYDATLDRLYVTNSGTTPSPAQAFIVYDQVSNQALGNTVPSWQLKRPSTFEKTMGIYIDKTRNLMLFLNAESGPELGLYVYDLTEEFRDAVASPNIVFPVNTAIGPTEKTLLLPSPKSNSADGLSADGPTALTVDEGRALVYVADKNNSVVVYSYYDESVNPPVPALTKQRTITGLNKPSGLFIDPQKDILYVSNNGEEPGATVNYTANTVFVFEAASTKGDGTTACESTTPCPPDRIISTVGLSNGAQNKLKAPISPYVDVTADRLYLINSASDQNAVFSFNTVSTLGDMTSSCIDGSLACSDTLPSKVIIGSKTNLDFSNTGALFTGAVVLSRNLNNEILYVGQSIEPLCTTSCNKGGLVAFGLEGALEPSKIWAGGGSSLTTPEALAIDSEKNMLYIVSESTNILSVFANADTVDVNTDASTGKRDLSNIQLNRPAGLFADTAEDRLYVANSEAFSCSAGPCNAILVFNNASTLVDGTTPSLTLTDAASSQPHGITLDPTSHRLYVANTGGDSVLIYNQTDTLNGVVAITADATLTGFSEPLDLSLDPVRNILYVLDRTTKKIHVFDNASSLVSGVSASRMISGDDGFGNNAWVNPSAIFVDAENDLLYLADPGANSVSVFTNASKAEGQDKAPKKTFLGDQTGLQSPSALTVGTPSTP